MPLSARELLQINQALFSLAQSYRSRLAAHEESRSPSLAFSDRAVLMVLGQLGPMSSRQLSQAMAINPGTISVYVLRLEELGLVSRTQDHTDRRTWWLALTENGRAAYQRTVAGAVSYTQDILAGLNETEQVELHRLLLKTGHALGFHWQ